MVEIDTIFTIKRPETVLEINRPYLIKFGITDSLKLAKIFGRLSEFEALCKSTFENAEDHKKVGRMKKYRLREEILLPECINGEELKNKIPIFVNGLSAVNYTGQPKMGLDPFSNSHLFSTLLLELCSSYQEEFLKELAFIYVQPVTWIQKFVKDNGNVGLEDLIRVRVENEVNPQINGIGFGTMTKFDDLSPKIGNSKYDPGIYSVEYLRKALFLNPHNYDDAAIFDSGINYNKLIESRKLEAAFNTEITAVKYSQILDTIFPNIIRKLQTFDMVGIPLYMEKTSESSKIMDHSRKYSKYPLNFKFVGGQKGILSTTPERIPTLGMCHPSALGRLIGLVDNLYMTWNKNYSRKTLNIKFESEKDDINYSYSRKYPFLLLEGKTENAHPNLDDLVDMLLENKEFNEATIKNVRDFAFTHRVGFSRIEPRIVNLLSRDASIYTGLRKFNKENRRWFAEIQNKLVMLPNEIPGFLNMPSIRDEKGDFRGSEFALRTSPIIDDRWVYNFQNGIIDEGCSIEKILGGLEKVKKLALLREAIPFGKSEDLEEFFLYHDSETLNSPAQVRGTFVHRISSAPLENLIHYDTLTMVDLKRTASDKYTETPFKFELQLNKSRFTASMHPDAYFFLKRDDKNFDAIIIDTKTNSVKPYIEHRYAQQTFFYGWLLKKIMKHHLDLNIENIYCVLNKNAFYKPMDKDKIVNPHFTYRRQTYSPITLFEPDNIMYQAIPAILGKVIEEKEKLINDKYFSRYKNVQDTAKRCSSCYKENKLICDLLYNRQKDGSSIESCLKK